MTMRTLSLASAVLLIMTVLGTGIVGANGSGNHDNKARGAAACAIVLTSAPTPTPTPTPTVASTRILGTPTAKVASFRAKVISRNRCGTIAVLAAVRHGLRGTTFSASAVAHFAGGDVTVQLQQVGKWFVAVGKIAVPASQAAGKIKVDVTIVYGGAAQPVISKFARIRAPKTGP